MKVYACFIDLRKAYDSVDRETLWNILELYGVRGKLLEAIKVLYKDTRAVVRVGDEESDKINLMRGVKQGCVLSPMIFNISMDFVTRQAMMRFEEEGLRLIVGSEECWKDPIKMAGKERETVKGSDIIYTTICG
jgi:hypothetical protein